MYFLCVQWIAECQGSIEDPSLSDWRREKLMEGVKLYKEFIQQCEQDILTLDTALQEQQAEQGKWIISGLYPSVYVCTYGRVGG